MNKQIKYHIIEVNEERKKRQHLSTIKREMCINCIHRDDIECLDIEETLNNSTIKYRCKNYKKVRV